MLFRSYQHSQYTAEEAAGGGRTGPGGMDIPVCRHLDTSHKKVRSWRSRPRLACSTGTDFLMASRKQDGHGISMPPGPVLPPPAASSASLPNSAYKISPEPLLRFRRCNTRRLTGLNAVKQPRHILPDRAHDLQPLQILLHFLRRVAVNHVPVLG